MMMSNYIDEDDDDFEDYKEDFWGRSPQSSYFEIAKTANQNIVEMELEKMFNRFAIAEKMLEERGLEEEHEKLLKSMVIDPELESRTNSLFIELVGNIVTQCE